MKIVSDYSTSKRLESGMSVMGPRRWMLRVTVGVTHLMAMSAEYRSIFEAHLQ